MLAASLKEFEMATYYRNHDLNRSDRTQIDACQAFYQKGFVCEDAEYQRPVTVCVSYDTIVAAIDCESRELFLFHNCDCSVTTMDHVKRFARRHGCDLFAADIHRAWCGGDVRDELHATRMGDWYVTACGSRSAQRIFGLDVLMNRASSLDY